MSSVAPLLAAGLFVLCGVAVCWGLITPVERLPLWSRTHDKWMHGTAFALLAVLASLSLPDTHFLLLWIALAIAGLLGEIAQHLTPHRSFCWRDAAANAVGAAVGLASYHGIIDRALS